MDRSEIADFAGREWQRASELKRDYWAERFRSDWRTAWNASQLLLDFARRVRAPFPSERERELDLADHQSLRARLDRAAHAFTRR